MTVLTPARPRAASDHDLFEALRGPDPKLADDACAALVRRYDWLARTSARRYSGRGESDEELRQVAYLGLLLAIRRFDPDRGTDFAAFARPTVLGELRRHFRDRRRWIRIPRRLQELRLQAATAAEQLTHTLGREPTTAELAAHLGIDVEEAAEVFSVDTFALASLDAPLNPSDSDSGTCADLLGEDDPRLDYVVSMTALRPLLAQLPPRDLRMVQLVLRRADAGPDRRADRRVPDARLPAARRDAAPPAETAAGMSEPNERRRGFPAISARHPGRHRGRGERIGGA